MSLADVKRMTRSEYGAFVARMNAELEAAQGQ